MKTCIVILKLKQALHMQRRLSKDKNKKLHKLNSRQELRTQMHTPQQEVPQQA